MRVACVSGSNIAHSGGESTSLRVCYLIGEICLQSTVGPKDFDIIALANHDLVPCIGCGRCYGTGKCQNDEQFNELYSRLSLADALFIVSAHYAPIPSKLCTLLEKIEQIAFLHRFNDEDSRSALYGKPLGIIAHGGGTDEMVHRYRGQVLDTIANALSWPVEMEVIKSSGNDSNGIAFGVSRVERTPGSIFPKQIYDWESIRDAVEPFVRKVLDFYKRTNPMK